MNLRLTPVWIALALAGTVAHASDDIYFGAGVGAAHFNGLNKIEGVNAGEEDAAAANAFVGYNFNEYFGSELGYQYTGRGNTDGNRYQIGFVNYDEDWTPGTPLFSDAEFDDLNRVIKMRQTGENTMVELLNISSPRKTDTYQLGFNALYQLTPQWSFTLDGAYSAAKNQNAGDNRFIVARGFVDAMTKIARISNPAILPGDFSEESEEDALARAIAEEQELDA